MAHSYCSEEDVPDRENSPQPGSHTVVPDPREQVELSENLRAAANSTFRKLGSGTT
jgi:hypothetical protein